MNAIVPANSNFASGVTALLASRIEFPAAALLDRAAMTAAINIAKMAVERRNTIPILSNVRLHADGGAVILTTTDMDMEIAVRVEAGAVDDAFAVTLPADRLETFLKKATACDLVAFSTKPGPLAVSATDNLPCTEVGECVIEFDAVKYRLKSLPVADFPILEFGSAVASFSLPGSVLWGMMDGTMGAISTEETRYYLNGIYMHAVQRGNFHALTLVATDGHRLYRQEIEAPNGAVGMPGAILPRKLVETFHKLTKGKACPASVSLEFDSLRARLAWGNIVLTAKLIDGTFPDYQRVIPSPENLLPMTVDRDALSDAVQAVSLISTERGRAVKFIVAPGSLKLVVTNPDEGNAVADLPCGTYEGPEFEIGFNAKYLIEALAECGAGEVQIAFGDNSYRIADRDPDAPRSGDPGSPVRLTAGREGWDAVLMPMRV